MKKLLTIVFTLALSFSAIAQFVGPRPAPVRRPVGPVRPVHHHPHSHALHGRDYGAIGLGVIGGAVARAVVPSPPPPPPVVVTPAPVVTTPVVVQQAPVVVQQPVTVPIVATPNAVIQQPVTQPVVIVR